MNMLILATPSELGPVQQAMRDQFQKGGSLRDVLLGFGTVLAVVVVAWGLTRRQQRAASLKTADDPWSVFHDLARRLGLPHPQFRMLVSVCDTVKPVHPLALMLSSRLFDNAAEVWRDKRANQGRPPSTEELRDLTCVRSALFPEESPWVFGGAGDRRKSA